MTRLIPLLVLITLLSACAPAVAPAATLTPTAIPATETPANTPTATLVPTQSPNQIAAGIEGLNMEREYIVRGEHLVDTYNQAPKAVLQEDGTWRALDYENPEDAEAMYGHLVPREIRYISSHLNIYSNASSKEMSFQAVYLGEVIWQKDVYEGEPVDVAYLLAGLRDEDGGLHVLRYGIDAPEAAGEHWYNVETLDPTDGTDEVTCSGMKLGEMVNSDCWIKPGEFIYEMKLEDPSRASRGYGEQWWAPDLNNYEYQRIMLYFFIHNKDLMMTTAEWQDLVNGRWPDRVVAVYGQNLTAMPGPDDLD